MKRSVFLRILGIALLAFAAYQFFSTALFLNKAQSTVGTIIVVKNVSSTGVGRNHNGGGVEATIVFEALQGRQELVVQGGAFFSGLKVGKQIPVLFDPENPKHAIKDTFSGRWGIVYSALSMGVLILFSERIATRFILPALQSWATRIQNRVPKN
jgi:hypothetical protein